MGFYSQPFIQVLKQFMTAGNDTLDKQKLIVLFIIGILYSFGVAYLFQSIPDRRYTDDLYPRLYASDKLLTEQRSLYDWQNAFELVPITRFNKVYQLGYYYPAYLMIFTGPLSQLPYGWGRALWTIFGLWSLWLSIVIFVKLRKPTLSANKLTILLFFATFSVPVFQHTLNAQFNSIGLLALALSYWASLKEKYFVAGLFAGGLFFKPQTTIIPLLFLLGWTLFNSQRRWFWAGLGIAGLSLWGIGELFESAWVFHFLEALGKYTKTHTVIEKLWDPYHIISIILFSISLWLIIRHRNTTPASAAFWGMPAWTFGINSLIVPLYGMLHMVSASIMIVALWHGYTIYDRAILPKLWYGFIGIFILGLFVFIGALSMQGTSGLQIVLAEAIYKISFPILVSISAIPLIFSFRKNEKTL